MLTASRSNMAALLAALLATHGSLAAGRKPPPDNRARMTQIIREFLSKPPVWRVTEKPGRISKTDGHEQIRIARIRQVTVAADGTVDLGKVVPAGGFAWVPLGTCEVGDLITFVAGQVVKVPADHFAPLGKLAGVNAPNPDDDEPPTEQDEGASDGANEGVELGAEADGELDADSGAGVSARPGGRGSRRAASHAGTEARSTETSPVSDPPAARRLTSAPRSRMNAAPTSLGGGDPCPKPARNVSPPTAPAPAEPASCPRPAWRRCCVR